MDQQLIAKATTTINIPVEKVWDALVNPAMIKQYMFGSEVVSDWQEGSSIIWKGVWEGKPYQDKGVIKKIVPNQTLQYTHYSPLSGAADLPENYHTLTYQLTPEGQNTLVTLTQDNNSSPEGQAHSQKMWESMLESLKKLLEK